MSKSSPAKTSRRRRRRRNLWPPGRLGSVYRRWFNNSPFRKTPLGRAYES